MNERRTGNFALLEAGRSLTAAEDLSVRDAWRNVLRVYRSAAVKEKTNPELTVRAREAFRHLGGNPAPSSASLKHYDHIVYGPFLGISDEGSATSQIRDAAFESPKARALPKGGRREPLALGMAVDAERLGGIGELAVGPDEYTDIWLEAVDRIMITTNVGTRVNVRVYRREPVILVNRDDPEAIAAAKKEIEAAFKPFVETPDKKPRSLTVFVDIPRYAEISAARQRAILRRLVKHVSSGRAAGQGWREAPLGQELGFASWVGLGIKGRDEAIAAIDIAADAGLKVVILDGVKRKHADRAISLTGLLDYFPPGLVGPILRHAARKNVRVRTGNLPDTNTIARSTWAGLTTARSHGANLGKYGCFPLTRVEIDHVVEQVQNWLRDWSAAPVFFVDQGLLREGGVDVGHDVFRGLKYWLETIARHGVEVALIDTIDKATGKRLLKKHSRDDTGFLSWNQIKVAEQMASRLGIKLLWAGGLGLRDTYEMGKLGVFGIYVTSAAATTIAVGGSYTRDPSLAGVKEPSKEAVLRTKILLESGFLSAKLVGNLSEEIKGLAEALIAAHDRKDALAVQTNSARLASVCVSGWQNHWTTFAGRADAKPEK